MKQKKLTCIDIHDVMIKDNYPLFNEYFEKYYSEGGYLNAERKHECLNEIRLYFKCPIGTFRQVMKFKFCLWLDKISNKIKNGYIR